MTYMKYQHARICFCFLTFSCRAFFYSYIIVSILLYSWYTVCTIILLCLLNMVIQPINKNKPVYVCRNTRVCMCYGKGFNKFTWDLWFAPRALWGLGMIKTRIIAYYVLCAKWVVWVVIGMKFRKSYCIHHISQGISLGKWGT